MCLQQKLNCDKGRTLFSIFSIFPVSQSKGLGLMFEPVGQEQNLREARVKITSFLTICVKHEIRE